MTLTGPGGRGKTRLALQAAAAAADDFGRGVWWVRSASLPDPALVDAAAVRRWVLTDELAEAVGDKRLLLVLDNFEQVVEPPHELAGRSARVRISLARHEPGAVAHRR